MSSLTPPDHTPPTLLSITLATAILAAATGYFLGTASSLGLFSSSSKKQPGKKKGAKKSWPNSYDVKIHPDSSDEELMTQLKGGKGKGVTDSEESEEEEEEEEEDDNESEEDEGETADLESFEENREECKLVLVVRTDLGMGKGKIAAQASHATLACYTHLLSHPPTPTSSSSSSSFSSSFSSPYRHHPLLKRWERLGQTKVALQAHSEEELFLLQAKAISLGLCAKVVRDAGRTQVASGTATVLGVGPGPRSVVDGVTGGLRLL